MKGLWETQVVVSILLETLVFFCSLFNINLICDRAVEPAPDKLLLHSDTRG